VYCLTLPSLKAVLQNSTGTVIETSQTNRPQSTETSIEDTDGFHKRKRKKRNITSEKSTPKSQPITSVPTQNFFTPLNFVDMDMDDRKVDEGRKETKYTPKGTGRPL